MMHKVSLRLLIILTVLMRLKAVFLKVFSTKGADYQISLLGFMLQRNYPDSKKLGFLKIANSLGFETVDFIEIGRTISKGEEGASINYVANQGEGKGSPKCTLSNRF